jgi:hypothetical protein
MQLKKKMVGYTQDEEVLIRMINFFAKRHKIPIKIKFDTFPVLWREYLTNEPTNASNSP